MARAQLLPIVPTMSFVAKGSSSESLVGFSCHVSLSSFNQEQLLSLPLAFVTLTRLQSTDQAFG